MLAIPIKNKQHITIIRAIMLGVIIGFVAGYFYTRSVVKILISENLKQEQKIEELEDLLHEEWFKGNE
ncbi:hypothetical protein KY334_05415 [Candidatus Woesearchaeota archaeon]|nr:hypothetical protein [Candidatus Woesearchaeota archaeon]